MAKAMAMFPTSFARAAKPDPLYALWAVTAKMASLLFD
jgi:hypothetical protein